MLIIRNRRLGFINLFGKIINPNKEDVFYINDPVSKIFITDNFNNIIFDGSLPTDIDISVTENELEVSTPDSKITKFKLLPKGSKSLNNEIKENFEFFDYRIFLIFIISTIILILILVCIWILFK